MRGCINLSEDQILETRVSATVTAFNFWQHDLFALAEALRQLYLRFDFNRPGLPLIVSNFQTALLSIERQTVTLEWHEGV